MVFSSLSFLCIFLPVVFTLHWVIPNIHIRNGLLIIASLIFYAYGEPVYVLLMIVSSFVNYLAARFIYESEYKKLCLVFAIIVNIGILLVFKYLSMIIGTFDFITGLNIPIPFLELPIGISFFTFQALSYVVDVYRGQVKAQRNYFDVLLYISFFPQLIAGPIVKYHDIAKQINVRKVNADEAAAGLRRFCFGLAKKVIIANNMAVAVDFFYSQSPSELNVLAAWITAIAYAIQIYFDFSGYSDMAIGLGHMFGFTFKENFNYPYISTSIQEFWRRWHISLSTWFKEYVYIPLGGNRKGKLRTSFNKIAIFFLCGLWHGASWTFVIWGFIHGAFLMLENYLPIKRLPRALGHVYAMLVVVLAFVLFRADTLDQGLLIISQMFVGWDFSNEAMMLFMRQMSPVFITTFALGLICALPIKAFIQDKLAIAGPSASSIGIKASFVLSFLLLIICFILLSSGAYNPFIYFKF